MTAPMSPSPPVTVIVPVYRGLDAVRRCLESIVRHAETSTMACDLLVIDDASPEADVRAYLEAFAPTLGRGRVRVLHNEANLGFVGTCNRGLRETTGDAVLLNADTVVTEGWLDRLADVASAPDVATVTPLSNFGSICTLPASVIAAFELAGDAPRIDECAEFVREQTIGRRPEVITGVGFCMYLTRRALDLCGLLDEETFGVGYGEEVDFCLRASTLGFRHLVEDATFVYHQGAVSFAEERQEGLERSSALIHDRYPYFRIMNLAERADDPLQVSFTALELGLRDRDPDRPHLLQVLHSRPGDLGGTEKHSAQLMEELLGEFDISLFQPLDASGFLLTTMWGNGREAPVRHEFHIPGGVPSFGEIDDPGAASALRTVIDMFDFDAVHLQNIFHHSLAPLEVLADFDGPVVCSVRDLYLGCPHPWLLYRNETGCGIPEDLEVCARCLPETRRLDVDYLQRFRATVEDRLDTVDHWVFASRSALDFFLRVYDPDPARVALIEHGTVIEHRRATRVVDEARIFDEPLRLAHVGIGWAKKGLPTLNRIADTFAGTDIEIHHFGELRQPISPHIHQHGGYDHRVIPELLDRAGIHAVLLPGAFAETFGHVMTESLIAGLPVVGIRYGALGERIRKHEAGWTVDPEDVDGIVTLIENLDRSRPEILRATRRAVAVELYPVAATAERYAALYRTDGARAQSTPERRGDGTVTEQERLQRELRAMAAVNRQLHAELTGAKRKPQPTSARSTGRTGAPPKPRGLVARAIGQARRVPVLVRQRGVRRTARDATRKVQRRLGRASAASASTRARKPSGVVRRGAHQVRRVPTVVRQRGVGGAARDAARKLRRRVRAVARS